MNNCEICNKTHNGCLGHTQEGKPCGRKPHKGEKKCWLCKKSENTKHHSEGSTILQLWDKKRDQQPANDFDEIAERFYFAFEQTCGNISASCKYAGIDRKTFYNWKKSRLPHHIAFRENLKNIQPKERQKDLLEAALMQQVAQGNISAIIFGLKTLGRDRGYGERPVSEFFSDQEKAEVIIGQIEKRAIEEGWSFGEELKLYLELFAEKLKPEIKGILLSELEKLD